MTVLDVARGELGTVESPRGSNRQKYGAWYGLNGQPWCSIFVAWCFDRVGINVRKWSTNWAYTPAALQGMRNLGMVVPTRQAQPGDIVFYDFPDSVKRTQHVGIVESVTATGVVSIEGNTGVGNDSNGGEVMRRTRPWAHISGVGRPTGAQTPPRPAPAPAPVPKPVPRPTEDHHVELYQFNLPAPEWWLVYADGFARNLNQANGEADAWKRTLPVSVQVSAADAGHIKNGLNELSYAAFKARKP